MLFFDQKKRTLLITDSIVRIFDSYPNKNMKGKVYMQANIRIKCPHCGEASNVNTINDLCPGCHKNIDTVEEGNIYIYRQGSFYGIAGGFGLFINGQPYGYIGNKELLRIPVRFGTYNIHSAVGMNRRCRDLQVTITPENPVAYTKVYMKPGFWTNSFVVEPLDPKKLEG